MEDAQKIEQELRSRIHHALETSSYYNKRQIAKEFLEDYPTLSEKVKRILIGRIFVRDSETNKNVIDNLISEAPEEDWAFKEASTQIALERSVGKLENVGKGQN